MRSTTRFARVLVVGLITVVAAGVAWPRAAAAADRTTWEIQVVTTTGDVVAPVGKGPFEKAFGGGIYIGGACALPKGTTAFVDLRLEEVGDGGLASAPLASRKLDQGFVVTNTSKATIDRIVIKQAAKGATFNGLAVGAGITSKVDGGTLTLTFDPPLKPGASVWFGLPPFDAGVTIEYVPAPVARPQPRRDLPLEPDLLTECEPLPGTPGTGPAISAPTSTFVLLPSTDPTSQEGPS